MEGVITYLDARMRGCEEVFPIVNYGTNDIIMGILRNKKTK